MKYLTVLLVLLVSIGVYAQNTKVIRLTDSDAITVKKAYDALQEANKNWELTQKFIKEKYVDKSTGFEYGFEFSDDFKNVVPKPYNYKECGYGYGGIYTFPSPPCIYYTTPSITDPAPFIIK